jgi:NAD(P)H-dependent nitrite reductase small subunit
MKEDFIAVCHLDDLVQDTGVAVRVGNDQVAVFLTDDGVFALDNLDPFSGAAVLSRGIVGDIQGHLVVASPMYKQHFCLKTGNCLEEPGRRVRSWPVRVVNEQICLRRPEAEALDRTGEAAHDAHA